MFGIVVSSVGIINVFFFLLYGAHLDLHVLTHSFPTRRSADLVGTDFALEIGGVRSPRFAIEENVWSGYLDEMTAFYRLQRSGVDTADAYPAGYSSIAPSDKVFHAAGHLDDAASEDGTQHYDLTGGWYDAGDYGIYGGNQWVAGNIAISYLRYGNTRSAEHQSE